MTEPLAVPIPEAARLGGVGRSTLYSVSKGILKVHKVGRLIIPKHAIAIYLVLAIGTPSPANILDTINLKVLASVKKYEFRGFIHQTEIGLEFELGLGGCATRNQNKMAEEEGFEPSVGY
jgi:hypothetical protein